MAFTDEEIQEFKIEAEELLDNAEKSLLALDGGGNFSSHYDSIFRAFHSIKGAAGMMELNQLQSHMHQLENIFTEQKNNKKLEKEYIDFFLSGSDAAREILAGSEVIFDYQVKSPHAHHTPTPPVQSTESIESTENRAIGTVLVIDDETHITDVLGTMIREIGMNVVTTNDSTKALSLTDEHHPDAILSDISMPGLDGIKLIQQLSVKHPDIPVILISAHVGKSNLLDAINSGVYAVIEKPFEAKHVISLCHNAVRKHRLAKLLNQSINLVMYQFGDLEAYLNTQGKADVANVIRKEINNLLEQKRSLKKHDKESRKK